MNKRQRDGLVFVTLVTIGFVIAGLAIASSSNSSTPPQPPFPSFSQLKPCGHLNVTLTSIMNESTFSVNCTASP